MRTDFRINDSLIHGIDESKKFRNNEPRTVRYGQAESKTYRPSSVQTHIHVSARHRLSRMNVATTNVSDWRPSHRWCAALLYGVMLLMFSCYLVFLDRPYHRLREFIEEADCLRHPESGETFGSILDLIRYTQYIRYLNDLGKS